MKTDSRSYSEEVGTPSPRVFQVAAELTWIIISGLALSKSFPANAFAAADEYHSEGSGAPENAEKKLPGRALPRTPQELERPHDASTVMTVVDLKFADHTSIAA